MQVSGANELRRQRGDIVERSTDEQGEILLLMQVGEDCAIRWQSADAGEDVHKNGWVEGERWR